MNIQLITAVKDPVAYNAQTLHPLQSYEWGAAKSEIGNKVVRFTDGSTNFTLTIHKIPYSSSTIGYLARSPIPPPQVFPFLEKLAEEENMIFIKIEPDIDTEEGTDGVLLFPKNTRGKLQVSPHPLFPDWTQTLTLQQSEEALLSAMKSKTRYNIRLAEKKGVTVHEVSTDEGFLVFSRLYFETCRRQKYHGHSQNYHQIVWNHMKQSIAHILLAEYRGVPLAAYELFHYQNKLYYPYGGTSDQNRNVMAANLIMWEAIRFGKKMGDREFDMWGSLGPHEKGSSDWSGFTRFKEGYGTRYTHKIGSFDYVISNTQYQMYTVAAKIRSWYLKR